MVSVVLEQTFKQDEKNKHSKRTRQVARGVEVVIYVKYVSKNYTYPNKDWL
jgi:hypothetical protein